MLNESVSELKNYEGQRAFISFFGKHHAWADHMDDLGLATQSLQEFKNWIYLEGIRKQIDSGSWTQLSPESQIKEWNHHILALGAQGLILAILAQSPDSRGRNAYPFCIAIHFPTPQLPAQLQPLWQLLDELSAEALQAKTQEEVISFHEATLSRLGEVMRTLSPFPSEGPPESERVQFIESQAFQPYHQGLRRTLYWISQELSNYAIKAKNTRIPKPKHCRLPLHSDMGSEALTLWLCLLRSQIKESTPLIFTFQKDKQFSDLFVGTLDSSLIFHYKTDTSASPLISEVPYNIDTNLVKAFESLISIFPKASLDRLPQIILNSDDQKRSMFGNIANRFFKT